MSTDVTLGLLIGAAVLLLGVLAVRVSSRFGLPTLLLYLGLGMALGESGLGIHFDDATLARNLGLAALVLILAEGGITTRWQTVRGAVGIGAVLATLGIAVSIAVTAAVVGPVLGVDWRAAVLFGAIVSSTDAAAVFATLRRLPLRGPLAPILEVESGFNDAPAVLLVVLLSADHGTSAGTALGLVGYELAAGGAIGLAVGVAGAFVLRRIALPSAGLYPLATVAFAVLAFAVGSLAHASGFLAIYLAGLVLGNSGLPHHRATLGFVEGLGWLAQIGLFVLLGLLASPQRLPGALLPALAIGAVLLLVARPLSVVVSSLWFRVGWRAQVFLSWAGLRGAVPIVLATIPISAGRPYALRFFDVVVVLVVVFTAVQGTSLPAVARRLGAIADAAPRELEVEAAPLEELDADLLTLTIPAGSRLHGVYVDELRLPRGAALSLVVRDEVSFVPDRDTRLQRGDELLLVATRAARNAAEERLRAVSEAGRLARWRARPPQPGG